MKSATTASTEMPQPAIAIPVWPVGTNSLAIAARARGRVELERDGHLPDRAVGADREHDVARRASRFAPVGTLSPAGGLRRSRSSTPCRAASAASSGSSEMNSCRPFSTSSPAAMQPFSSSRHAGGKRPPAVATPTSAVVGS